jgi:hypothetical protein
VETQHVQSVVGLTAFSPLDVVVKSARQENLTPLCQNAADLADRDKDDDAPVLCLHSPAAFYLQPHHRVFVLGA